MATVSNGAKREGAGNRRRRTSVRTASGKRVDAAVMADAEQRALAGVRARTEAGHAAAGRGPERRTRKKGSPAIDDALRAPPSVTEDEKLLQQTGPAADFTRTDTWRVLRMT